MTDAAAVERAHEIFDPIAATFLQRGDVDVGPMFGSEGLRVRGKVFAFVGYRGSLIVKVPEERADALVSEAGLERMEMRGRVMREWVIVGPDHRELWQPLTGEAFAYLDDITP